MDKIINAIKLISNSRMFDDYIFYLSVNDKERYPIIQKCLNENPKIIKYNKALFCSLIYMFIKEQVIEDIGNLQYKSKVYDEYLETLIKIIATKKDNKYIIDQYEAEDAPTIITTIRHKFAHGDYIIDEESNNIIFYKDNKEMKIDIDRLTIVGLTLNKYLDIIQKNKPIDRNLIEIKDVRNLIKEDNIQNKEELKKVFEKMYIHNFYITGMKDKNINLEEAKYIHKKLDELTNYLGTKDFKSKKNEFIEFMSKNKILVNVTKKQYILYKEQELLLNYIENVKEFYTIPLEQQLLYLAYFSNDTIEDKYGKFAITKGCETNLGILVSLEKMKKFDIVNNCQESLQEELFVKSIESSISSSIQRFHAIYGYPLDKIYKEKGDMYLLNRENSLDFSLLDLSAIEPSILTINDNPEKQIVKVVDKLVKQYQSLNSSISKTEENILRFKNSNHREKEKIIKINEEKLIVLRQALKENMKEIVEKMNLRLQIEEDFKNNHKHFRNKAIIDGIRNAISHGNVEVDKFNIDGDLNHVKLHFKDIYKGKVTFEATIPYYLFESLYCDKNVEEISKFFKSQIEKNKVKKK